MKERENRVEPTNDFNESIQHIINEMNVQRNHGNGLDAENIRQKIFSIDLKKPGEYVEFMEAHSEADGRLTTDLALEMADIIYYTSQQNCPEEIKPIATELEELIGVSHELAQQFCIKKYRCRLEQPISSTDHKQKEYQMMSNFLNNKKLNFLP